MEQLLIRWINYIGSYLIPRQSPRQNHTCEIDRLPSEIIREIFKFLSLFDLYRVQCVSKKWKNLASTTNVEITTLPREIQLGIKKLQHYFLNKEFFAYHKIPKEGVFIHIAFCPFQFSVANSADSKKEIDVIIEQVWHIKENDFVKQDHLITYLHYPQPKVMIINRSLNPLQLKCIESIAKKLTIKFNTEHKLHPLKA